MRTVIVYVHGLWLTGIEGFFLRRRLGRAFEADTYAFGYPSVRLSLAANASTFSDFLTGIKADTLHIVAHSLGGLVTLKTFESAAASALPPGRLVLLGPPLQGSLTARRVAGLPFGETILGLGRLTGKHSTASDGTVFVEETQLDGATDHLQLRVSHTGLPFSKEVAVQCGAFLRDGRFNR
jgi:pimeloyl-ACP methyl ester carboxylesterase